MLTFQFHKGSIKTKTKTTPLTRGSEFQFHKGSIKTVLSVRAIDVEEKVSIPQRFD